MNMKMWIVIFNENLEIYQSFELCSIIIVELNHFFFFGLAVFMYKMMFSEVFFIVLDYIMIFKMLSVQI